MQNKRVSDKLLLGAIIVSMFLWGLSWPSAKVLTNYTSPINFSVYRYIVVVATMLPILFFSGSSFKIRRAGIPAILCAGGLLSLYSYFFFMGLKNGSPGAGGVLVTTLNPIVAYIVGTIVSRKAPTRNETAGLILGLIAGSVLLKMWSNVTAIMDGGNLYFLLAACTWAVMSKFTAKGASYGSSLGFSLWQYVITLLCLVPLMNMHEFRNVVTIQDPLFWSNLFFSSAIVTSLATTVYFYTTTRLGAEKASSFIFLVPLAASVSSWLFLEEKILPHTIIGGMLGISAVYIINRKKPVPAVSKKTSASLTE
jgi:drug/metabolite transporter (DMT)-like permease